MIELDVVVRCRNEMPHTRRTLHALAEQEGVRARVLFLDCGSTDGSREEAVRARADIRDIAPADYVPGAVMNRAMGLTRSPLVAFVNADAVPLEKDALRRLVAPLERGAAATFGRQDARPSADAQTQRDQRRAFAEPLPSLQRGKFFSMAAAALRRDAWQALGFDEQLRYSEDVDWTHRASALGFQITYVPGARFEHSHDYSIGAHLRRRRGEGAAETRIFRLGGPSPVRELLRPFAGSLARDLRGGTLGAKGVAVRTAQALGRYLGRLEGARPRGPGRIGSNDEKFFTLSREPAEEKAIKALLDEVRAEVLRVAGPQLRGLSLVGSHARGEGAVCRRADGTILPHNDLDLVAVVRSSPGRWRARLHQCAERLSARCGFEVGLWTVGESLVERAPPTLFWLDIALGGEHCLFGRPLQPRLSPREVPLDEAGRLLANRAVGLALSNLDGAEAAMLRHGHKAVLACGDALLLAADRYAPTMRARLEELRRLAPAPAVGGRLLERYAEAARYRADPDGWKPPGSPSAWYEPLRAEVAGWHLSFEAWRQGSPLTAAAFALQPGRVYASLPDVRRGAAMLSAMRAAASGATPLLPWVGHPRERLARAAVALAYGFDDPAAQAAGRRLLGLGPRDEAATVAAKLRTFAALAG